jgi:hypothetical protein
VGRRALAYLFSSAERNERTYGHAPFADVHAVAANFRHVSSQDGDGNSDRITEIAPSFSQYQSVSRDALNRVRTAAWAAQQYVARKESDQDSTSVFSLMAGERIRAAYQLCQAIGDDLKRTDIKFQAGSLVHLHEAAKTLTEQLMRVIDKM